MQAVLISVNPKWCEKIASGEKTIEVRKTKPKIDVPFKCYIYETKGKTGIPMFIDEEGHEIYQGRGQVIGEFICDSIEEYEAEFTNGCHEAICLNRYNKDDEEIEQIFITSNEFSNPSNCHLCIDSCLSFDEIKKYIFNGESGFFVFYGWSISDLKIYDKPKELSEFKKACINKDNFPLACKSDSGCCEHLYKDCHNGCYSLTRPPQSWQYVDSLEGE